VRQDNILSARRCIGAIRLAELPAMTTITEK